MKLGSLWADHFYGHRLAALIASFEHQGLSDHNFVNINASEKYCEKLRTRRRKSVYMYTLSIFLSSAIFLLFGNGSVRSCRRFGYITGIFNPHTYPGFDNHDGNKSQVCPEDYPSKQNTQIVDSRFLLVCSHFAGSVSAGIDTFHVFSRVHTTCTL